jgi:protein-tyrosine-phosphatase
MRILFVCHGNAYRSPLAEALLKKLRPDLEVDSAGLHVAIPISDTVKDYLRKRDAAQYLKAAPQSLDEKKLRGYDVIVAMDGKIENFILRKCFDCWEKTVTWTIKDPYFEVQDREKIFNEIENKVKELASSL